MIAIISLLLVVLFSILITRIATLALTHTGLSREAARFQARSAFTGSGFTTSESEKVVNHPIRRRIVLLLMLLGNAGVVTAVSSLILSFVSSSDDAALAIRIVFLVAGLVLLWSFASSKWVDKWLSTLIDKALNRFTSLDVTDYASLLHLIGDYRLAEMQVKEEDWISGKTLQQLRLRDEGVNVLGIQRKDGTYLGSPGGDTEVCPGDSMILYGRVAALRELDSREKGYSGDLQHEKAVGEQQNIELQEKKQDYQEQHKSKD
ncbi:potassium transporter TrkA [candidate division KSB1 bacterium]|nr:potassium transporter TrkA [candidate division KSB1 bacterium]